jgi:hypothetical protein
MESEQTYGKRLHKAAREDFKNFWSRHRVWVTIATLTSPFLVQSKNHGWRSLLTSRETFESVGLALGLSLIGNYLIALWGGARSIDTALRGDLAKKTQDIQRLTPRRNQADEYYHNLAAASVANLSENAKKVMREIWSHNEICARAGKMALAGLTVPETTTILQRDLASVPFVRTSHGKIEGSMSWEMCWEIVPAYKEVLRELLFPE